MIYTLAKNFFGTSSLFCALIRIRIIVFLKKLYLSLSFLVFFLSYLSTSLLFIILSTQILSWQFGPPRSGQRKFCANETKFVKTRRQVPASRYLILVRSRLQLEFKLGCRGGATHARYGAQVPLPLVTKLRYRRSIFNPEDPVGLRANPLKVKASPVYICRRSPGLPPRVTIPSEERQLLSERPHSNAMCRYNGDILILYASPRFFFSSQ